MTSCHFLREPNARNAPVRFDEREQETEPSQTGLRRRRESFVSSHRETKATAPVLDSTCLFAGADFRFGCNYSGWLRFNRTPQARQPAAIAKIVA